MLSKRFVLKTKTNGDQLKDSQNIHGFALIYKLFIIAKKNSIPLNKECFGHRQNI